jgi:hypothetical protein
MSRLKFPQVAMAVLAIGLAGSAHAVTDISSSAYGLGANLTVLSLVTVGAGPFSTSAGVAPAAYSNSDTVLSVSDNLNLILGHQTLSTGVITTAASSPFPVTPTGTAAATVNNLGTGLGLLFGPSLLSIGATTITSTSSVDGTGTLTALGSSDLEGLTVTGTALGGLTIDGSLYAHAAPNTVLINLAGLEIILNEQIPSGDGVNSEGIQTNAIDIKFDHFALGTGLLSGGIIVAHSQADITGPAVPVTPVPEPATWAELLAGFVMIGGFARRRAAKTA